MKAIILAAGRGSRMEVLTEHQPKCMLPLQGKPLIEWQIEALQSGGVKEIAVVKGYCAEAISYPVHSFSNKRWQQTNMLSTLLCADEWLSSSECIVSYADIIYLAQAIEKLCSSVNNITILFDQNWRQLWERRFTDPLSDAEIFKYAGNHLLDIGGKAQDFSQIQGQYMGLLKFTPEGWRQVKNFIQQFSEAMVDKMDMTSLLK